MKKIFITLTLLLTVVLSVKAQMPQMPQFPMDQAVRYGKLENGLTYYIRHNELPEHQVDFYIAQKVGSALEEESQRGLAHFLEHMAFNGTKNFPGKAMLNYLEKNGVKFGVNVNAQTDFDRTTYMITNVPTTEDHPHIVDSVLLMIHDWSGCLSLEDEEIDNERGVIHEEWRSTSSAQLRMLEHQVLPKLFPNTPYPVRLPIGIMEVVDSFKYDELRNYYKKWYRPDLQGVIIVGDVDVDYVESQIKELWKDIVTPADAAVREYAQIADHEGVLAAVGKDKEFPQNIIEFGFKTDKMPVEMRNTQLGLIQDLVENVIANVFSLRISEAVMTGKTTMLGGGVGFGDYIVSHEKEATLFSVAFKENDWKQALDDMIDMVNTLVTYGITQAELDRVKADIISSYENSYNERDKRKNGQFIGSMLSHFYDGEGLLDIEMEFQLVQQMLNALPLEVYNQTLQQVVTPNNRVIFTMAQEKDGASLPTEEELIAALNEGLAREAKPFEENAVAANLMTSLPKAGTIVKTEDTDFGFKVWTLSNGAKIVWKQTDFKKDQILVDGISKRGSFNLSGLSRVEQSNLSTALSIGGMSEFSAIDLNKVLAGKNVSVNRSVDRNSTVISGNSTPKDFRTLMELIYLSMTQPRMDSEVFDSWFKRSVASMKTQEGTPDKIQSDSLTKVMYQGQPELYPMTVAEFESIDYKNMFDKAASLYTNAADFTFYMIGNIDEDSLKVMAEQYIAALPAAKKPSAYKKDYQMPSKGSREMRFDLPMAQPMTTVYNFYNIYDQKLSLKDQIALDIFGQIAQMTFTETIREREGGVYSPGAGSGSNPRTGMMQFLYMFVTGADKLAHIEEVADIEARKLGDEIGEEYFQKARDYIVKNHQQNLMENSYWLGSIEEKMQYGNDNLTGFEQVLQSLTPADVQAVAKMFFDTAYRVQFISNGVEQK